MGCRVIEMHPTRTATGATRKHSKNPTTHPTLMFHYRVFGCLGGVFAAGDCCNLLHFVHKLLHTPVDGDKSCILFTKCSQTVAHCQKSCKLGVPTDPAIAYVYEGAIRAMTMSTTPQPYRRRSRSDLVHLRSLPSGPARYQDRAGDWAWGEIEAGLAAGMKLKEVWEAARKDGIDSPYAQFRVYISRLRRRRQRSISRRSRRQQ